MKIAIIGECMMEMANQGSAMYSLNFGGDTLNTAIYLARLGGKTDYFSVLGDDPFSQHMLAAWQAEGVGIAHVKIQPNALPGLYFIENDDSGERHFHYWRDNAPARKLLENYPDVLDELMSYPMIFLTGITLSIFSDAARQTLYKFLATYRKSGGKVIFDNNYRPRNWVDVEQAQTNFKTMMALSDTALISFDDELLLWGEQSVESCTERWVNAGVKELVVKNGHKGCVLAVKGVITTIPLEKVVMPIDTTAAGDSFNGAYLAAKAMGDSPKNAVLKAQKCASVVIQHKGAIVDKQLFFMEMQ